MSSAVPVAAHPLRTLGKVRDGEQIAQLRVGQLDEQFGQELPPLLADPGIGEVAGEDFDRFPTHCPASFQTGADDHFARFTPLIPRRLNLLASPKVLPRSCTNMKGRS